MRATELPANAEKTVTLACPFCDAPVPVADAVLVFGETMLCPQCREECLIDREWDEQTDDYHWVLADPGEDEVP